jgi:hypothetical protein
MSKTYLNPQALFSSQQYGFSQGVAALGKTTVYVSGQVGWNAIQQITDPADLVSQDPSVDSTLTRQEVWGSGSPVPAADLIESAVRRAAVPSDLTCHQLIFNRSLPRTF